MEALIVTRREIGLEKNADKTKYMVVSRQQNERTSHYVKFDNNSFEWVQKSKYLGTALTNHNSGRD
jgi:hypothetical protein